MDTPATGRSKSSVILNRHVGLRYAPQGIVNHRVSPPKDVHILWRTHTKEEDKPPPSRSTNHLDLMKWIAQLLNSARIWSTRGTGATLLPILCGNTARIGRPSVRRIAPITPRRIFRTSGMTIPWLTGWRQIAGRSISRVERSLIYANRRIVWSASAIN